MQPFQVFNRRGAGLLIGRANANVADKYIWLMAAVALRSRRQPDYRPRLCRGQHLLCAGDSH